MRTLEQDTRGGRRVVSCIVNANGTVNYGTGFTVTKTGTGTYTILFAGYRTLTSLATAFWGLGTAFVGATITQPNVVSIALFTSSSVASDGPFSVVVDGIAR